MYDWANLGLEDPRRHRHRRPDHPGEAPGDEPVRDPIEDGDPSSSPGSPGSPDGQGDVLFRPSISILRFLADLLPSATR